MQSLLIFLLYQEAKHCWRKLSQPFQLFLLEMYNHRSQRSTWHVPDISPAIEEVGRAAEGPRSSFQDSVSIALYWSDSDENNG